MAVDINFINLDDNNAVMGSEVDLEIGNSVLLDLQFDITEPEDHVGFIYRNDAKIGEFGKTQARGKYLEWYSGTGVPIYVKNGDNIKAVVQFDPLSGVNLGPGPQTLIGYTKADNKGFFGQLAGNELIYMYDLISQVGVTLGIDQNLYTPWLKFYLDGRILFVAKKSIRHITYDHLRDKGVVDGSKVITINGLQYRVGLLSGIDEDYTGAVTAGFNQPYTMRSEWNRLMYNVASDEGIYIDYQKQGQIGDNWISYPQDDSTNGLNISEGNGRYSWCKDLNPANPTEAVRRGSSSVASVGTHVSSGWGGWRPVLELIQE